MRALGLGLDAARVRDRGYEQTWPFCSRMSRPLPSRQFVCQTPDQSLDAAAASAEGESQQAQISRQFSRDRIDRFMAKTSGFVPKPSLKRSDPIRRLQMYPNAALGQRAGIVMSGAGADGPDWMRLSCMSSASVSFERMSSLAML